MDLFSLAFLFLDKYSLNKQEESVKLYGSLG